MRTLPILLLSASLHAAEIHGTVVENQSGYPLARATVTLLAAGQGTGKRVITNVSGIFAFTGIPAGIYTLSAEHLAFAPVHYGQKRWPARGMPIVLEGGDSAELTIRMPRYGAISGTVLDENDIGLPEHDVAVYNDSHPPKLLARARTDDRGVYRFFGLRPGSYLVRSLAMAYDGGGYLPTFYGDSAGAGDAHRVPVKLDEQVDHVDLHALPGRLFEIAGRVGFRQGTVILSSDTGSETATVQPNGTFTFPPAAPGPYELLAQSDSDRSRIKQAGFRTITVDRDYSDWTIQLASPPSVQIVFEDQAGNSLNAQDLGVMVRRRNPAGEKTETQLVLAGTSTVLPGHWEFAFAPNPAYCVVGPDGWRDLLLEAGSQTTVKFVLSPTPATLSGTVKDGNGKPLEGVTVFVEADVLGPIHTAHTGADGKYTVGGLAGGVYRVMAGDTPEVDVVEGQTIKVEEGGKALLDLNESGIL